MKYIAQTISYILHPMLMPLYILFFIFNNNYQKYNIRKQQKATKTSKNKILVFISIDR